ncbi:uncharacterized protein NKAPD1-like [Watersipora subatra]|uniref:uncharacterized protein NKAPD1-like n=1 Tax=Watersipora subatra TaxID=2589382 RepID=UPI00355BF7DF
MVSKTSKLLIMNAVRRTEAHNKRVEEKDMWNLRTREIEDMKLEKELKRKRREEHLAEHRASRHHVKKACSTSASGRCLAREDCVEDTARGRSGSHKWMTELVRYEESLGDERWGHGGYKELYPEEFRNNSPRSSFSSKSADEVQTKLNKKKSKPSYQREPSRGGDTLPLSRGGAYGPEPPVFTLTDSDSATVQRKSSHKHLRKKSKKSKKKSKHKKSIKERI